MQNLIFDGWLCFFFNLSFAFLAGWDLDRRTLCRLKQSLSELHVNSSWAAVECSCVFWAVLCFLFNFLPFWGWDRTGQFLCQAPRLLSPTPGRQEGCWDYSRCRWLCSKVHISCKKAQLGMLKTSWKTRLMFALCSGVLQKASSLEPALQKWSQEEFSNASCWSHRAFQTGEGRRCFVRDPVQDLCVGWLACPGLPLQTGMGCLEKEQKSLAGMYEPELAVQKPVVLDQDVLRFGKGTREEVCWLLLAGKHWW